MIATGLLVLLCSLPITYALPRSTSSPRPLVIWHGLGDSYASEGMLEFTSLLKDMFPGIYVHSIYMNEDNEEDKKAGFYGHVTEQIAFAAEQIANVTELKDGFDAVGFSQGGQFLRAYVQMYNTPPVHNLVTFGSQHMGISDIPQCGTWDILCQIARRIAKSGVYSEWAQANLVQAQYYRDPHNYQTYLEASQFLASLNNEIQESRNETYAENFASIEKLVLVLFTEDTTVIPPASSWFGAEAVDGDDIDSRLVYSGEAQEFMALQPNRLDEPVIIPMRMQPLYTEDWIGLRKLDESGKVAFESCEGPHMDLSSCWREIVAKYIGQPTIL